MMTNESNEDKTSDAVSGQNEPVVMYHYFCLTFIGSTNNGHAYASTYLGLKDKKINKQLVDDNKLKAGIDIGAVLLSASYLGYMSEEEMKGSDT